MIIKFFETLSMHDQWIRAVIAFLALLPMVVVSNMLTKYVVLRAIRHAIGIVKEIESHDEINLPIASRVANIAPLLIVFIFTCIIPDLPDAFIQIIQNICSALIIFTLMRAFAHILNYGEHVYMQDKNAKKTIKGYIQVAQLLVNITAILLVISLLIDQNPLVLFSGLGAMAAVLMLIFKDTILSFVASVQINTSGLVSLDDWIEVPSLGIRGVVKDVALHTITIQNSDKTLTILPLQKLTVESFKSWRGVLESGRRKIKRSLLIDQTSIRFMTQKEIDQLPLLSIMRDYLDGFQKRNAFCIGAMNKKLLEEGREPVKMDWLTNIGVFREYMRFYLSNHERIYNGRLAGGMSEVIIDMPLIRLLPATATGLPVEINCFVNESSWIPFEETQSEVLEHFIAVMPQFGLRLFQSPSPNGLLPSLPLSNPGLSNDKV